MNTWSVVGLYDEATSPIELGWGTHEQWLPPGARMINTTSMRMVLQERGMDLCARSWVPHGNEFIGMLIPHEEVITISNYLSLKEPAKIIYQPSVYFVYMPCHAAYTSLRECKMDNYQLLGYQRVAKQEVVAGEDQVGVLLLGNSKGGWWAGSVVSVEQARSIVLQENATTLQVAAGVISALVWALQHPQTGFHVPDNLPHEEILEIAKPYLGTFISQHVDWHPKKQSLQQPDVSSYWQFKSFLVKAS